MDMMQEHKYLPLIYSNEKWSTQIKPILQKIIKSKSPIDTVKLLKLLYQKVYRLRYGPNANIDKHSFKQLYSEYSDCVQQIFCNLAEIVKSFEKQKIEIEILYSQCSKQINFTKKEVLLLMAMMALGITGIYADKDSFPNFTDFGFIFSQQKYKTKTIIQYFKVQLKNYKQKVYKYEQKLTLGRICLERQLALLIKQLGSRKMNEIKITQNDDSIENYFGDLKVDFANMYIGGGALLGGLVQQQIMFANHPEMFISVLFCQVMTDNQAIYFAGFKKYWKNIGYSYTTQFQGKQQFEYKNDNKNRLKQYIVAIDAVHFYSKQDTKQFEQKYIDREILKCITGFSYQIESDRIVTGNWGCGAFSGNHSLKLMIQWISSSMLGKKMIYCPFGFKNQLNYESLIKLISEMKVNQVYELLINYSKQISNGSQNIMNLMNKTLVSFDKQ